MNPVIFGDDYPGFVYFIQMEDIGPIKIGYAKNYHNRLRALQSANPRKLTLLYATPGSQEDEQMIHRQIRARHPDLCMRGEWYLPAKLIFDTITEFKRWDAKDSKH